MPAINAGDILKDHKGVLLPLLAVIIIVGAMGAFMNSGGNFLSLGPGESTSKIWEPTTKTTYDSAPEMDLQDGVDYRATLTTNYGDIEVDLFEDRAPMTVNNFVFLAEDDFYDNLIFHRVISNFVIQGGDPKGDGTGGPGYSFGDEINPNALGLDEILVKNAPYLSDLYSPTNAATVGYSPNSLREHENKSLADFYEDVIGYDYDYSLDSYGFEPGVIAMANSGPGTNGSQFFVTVSNSDTDSLNGRHAVFGKVIGGMGIVDEIARVDTDSNDKPVDDVIIEKVVIEKK